MRRFHPLLILFVFLGAAASFTTLAFRHRAESANRAVELIVDYPQVRSLAMAAGLSVPDALRSLRDAGVVSVTVSEQTLSDLVSMGAARFAQEWRPEGGQTVTRVRFADPAVFDRVLVQFRARCTRLDPRGEPPTVIFTAPGRQVALAPRWEDLRGLGVGLPPEESALVRGAGLGLVGRLGNFTGAQDASIDWLLRQLREAGAHLVIFTGDDVLGHQARVEATARSLRAHGLEYGSIELGKQHGDEELSKALDARIVRVHSIRAEEMARLSPAVAIERFVRGVRERNIRVAYLRLFTSVAENPLDQNLDFIRGVAGELRDRAYTLGPARPFGRVLPRSAVGRLLPAMAALLVVGGGVMLLASVAPLPRGRQLALALLAGAPAMGLAAFGGHLGPKLLAFAGAVTFPTLAFTVVSCQLSVVSWGRGEGLRARSQLRPGNWQLATTFAAMSGVSLLGALSVAGLLSSHEALVKVSDFAGIKLAHVVPLLAIALIAVAGLAPPLRSWEEHRRDAIDRVSRFLGEPLRLWHVCVGLVGLAVLGLIVLRTGNDPGVGVSATELRLRSLLDQLLVRPRTKEFLIGHPLLLVGLWMAARGRSWATPLLIVGALGQVSLVNSFCHLHTPIALTAARTWNGLWLGALIGLVLVVVLSPRRHGEYGERDGETGKRRIGDKEGDLPVSPSPRLPVSPSPSP